MPSDGNSSHGCWPGELNKGKNDNFVSELSYHSLPKDELVTPEETRSIWHFLKKNRSDWNGNDNIKICLSQI